MNKKSRKSSGRKRSNKAKFVSLISMTIIAAIIGWLYITPASKTYAVPDIIDCIANLPSALRIQSPADTYLNEIYEKDLKDVFESENTKVSVARVDNMGFVNILSMKRDFLGDFRIGYFDGKYFQFDLLF